MNTGEIVFEYRPTADDYRTALGAWFSRTWPGRRAMVLPAVMSVAGVVVYGLVRGFDPGIGGIVTAVVLITAVVGAVRARSRIARESFAAMEPHGDSRTVLGETGIVITGGGPDRTVFDWPGSGGPAWYHETPGLFVLTADKGRTFLALPKRGAADPADVDRVRELLDRNLKRY
ncbi:hypothetical protein DEJ50_22895 [Streptomyces venezuelae]|uniref:YcxB-like protein domain-containing protein n=1 Tax=Streptomyces venezuelae TaxID=54571 RepID=A0A5P2D7R9_STRVZ|nr:hypothetical protein [Streptomyces venezuelae]QES50247.1 hypothetical protein DEJ50_22895 [Streptomyces venezuelae]